MAVNAVDADLVKQLQLSAEMICSTFHVPGFKVGVAEIPAGQKVGDLNPIYYSDCLHSLIKSIEDLLDEGLGLTTPKGDVILGTYFELEDLLAMDQTSQTTTLVDKVKGALMTPNEARVRLNLAAAAGGDSLYMQQQNYSTAALAKRDAREDPFASAKPPAPPAPEPAAPAAPAAQPAPPPKTMPTDEDLDADITAKALAAAVIAGFLEAANVE
jgi:phage portal protein BeeE